VGIHARGPRLGDRRLGSNRVRGRG
jgi:hypothetical protein